MGSEFWQNGISRKPIPTCGGGKEESYVFKCLTNKTLTVVSIIFNYCKTLYQYRYGNKNMLCKVTASLTLETIKL